MRGSSSSAITSRSMPEAMPPCGGAPIASASSRKPNFSRCSSGRCPGTRRPAAEARARGCGRSRRRARCRSRPGRRRRRVALAGSVSKRSSVVGGRARERVVRGVPGLGVLVVLGRCMSTIQRNSQRDSSTSSSSRPSWMRSRPSTWPRARLVGHEEQRVPGSPPLSRSASSRNLAIGSATSPSSPDDDVGKPLGAPRLRLLLERLERPCARAPSARRGSARPERREDTELGAPRGVGCLLDLHAEAQVGLVDAEAEMASS